MRRSLRILLALGLIVSVVLATYTVVPGLLLHKTISRGIPVVINVLPDATSRQLSSAYVQLWSFGAPPLPGSPELTHFNNTQPFLQLLTNSTGVAEGYLPLLFLGISSGWASYFRATGQNGSETSFSVQITYQFRINSSAYMVVPYSDFIPYNPEIVNQISPISIAMHPNLAERPYFISYNGNPYSVSPSGSLVPMLNTTGAQPSGIGGGGGGCNPVYGWDVWNTTTYDNMNLPLQFANDTGAAGGSEISLAVTIGSDSTSTSFNAGEGYHSSTTLSSNFISTGASYTTPKGILGTTQGSALPPQTNKQESFVYTWINGDFTITNWREKAVYPCTDQHYWLNNYETVPYISSLTVSNGGFVMGRTFWGYNASNPYTSPAAQAQLGLSGSLASKYSTSLAVGSEVQWYEIYNTVTGNYNNIQGTVNDVVGLGIAYLSFMVAVATVSGWSPGSGWGLIGVMALAISGLTAAVLTFLLNGIVSTSSSVFVFSADFMNNGLPTNQQSGNAISLNDFAVSTTISYNGNLYTFPILYGVGN